MRECAFGNYEYLQGPIGYIMLEYPDVAEYLKNEGISPDTLKALLERYTAEFPKPDHYVEPFEYIEAITVYDTIEDFKKLL